MRETFYSKLQSMANFNQIFESTLMEEVPDNWTIIMTDVRGSTKAIEEGRYKDVNSAGSLAAMAIANILGTMDFPFVFGGDGMTCVIENQYMIEVASMLHGLKNQVKIAFDLELRTGYASIKELKLLGYSLRCGKLKVSEQYFQAILEGDAIEKVEYDLKNDLLQDYYFDSSVTVEPDLRGYSCRWKDFLSPKDETIALIVKFRNKNTRYLQAFLGFLDSLVGEVQDHHPLTLKESKPRWTKQELENEIKIFHGHKAVKFEWIQRFLIRTQIIAVLVLTKIELPFPWGKKNLAKTKIDNINSSDYRKYDGSLKMILSIDSTVSKKLETQLDLEYKKKRIFYGIHRSNRAILTCLMKSNMGQEVHFVDAADGGYALAAKKLKLQMLEYNRS